MGKAGSQMRISRYAHSGLIAVAVQICILNCLETERGRPLGRPSRMEFQHLAKSAQSGIDNLKQLPTQPTKSYLSRIETSPGSETGGTITIALHDKRPW